MTVEWDETPEPVAEERKAVAVTCLACGTDRIVHGLSRTAIGQCPECGYVGWMRPVEKPETKGLPEISYPFRSGWL